eukprot:13074-Heterococcus_DN1.PRE.2
MSVCTAIEVNNKELEAEIELVKTELSSSLKLQAVYRLSEAYYSSRYNQYVANVRQYHIRKAFAAWSDKTTINQSFTGPFILIRSVSAYARVTWSLYMFIRPEEHGGCACYNDLIYYLSRRRDAYQLFVSVSEHVSDTT